MSRYRYSKTCLFLLCGLLTVGGVLARATAASNTSTKESPKIRLIPDSEIDKEKKAAAPKEAPLNDRGERELIGPPVELQGGISLLNRLKNYEGNIKGAVKKEFRKQLQGLLDDQKEYELIHLGCDVVEDSDEGPKKQEHLECILRYNITGKNQTSKIEVLFFTDKAEIKNSVLKEVTFHLENE